MLKRLLALLIVALGTTLGLIIATQMTAAALGYHKQLGQPVARWHGSPLYGPWQYGIWYLRWGQSDTAWGAIIHGNLRYILSGWALGMLGVIACKWQSKRAATASTIHGSGRWATKREIHNAGLNGSGNSIILGAAYGHYLRHNGEEHVMVIAPTKAGKTAGVIIPSLLSLTGSVVALDIKGELWEHTAGWRGQHGPCIYVNPCALDSARYNVLADIRPGIYETQDVQGIVEVLTNPSGDQKADSPEARFWSHSEQAFLTGVILHVLYAESDKTLRGVVRFLSDPTRTLEETLDVMRTTHHLPQGPHPLVAEPTRDLLNASANTRAGINQGVLSHLALYRDPILERMTSASDFRLSDLQYGAQPMSMYLVIPPSELLRVRPWLRLMLQAITRTITRKEHAAPRRNVDVLLDEFPTLGAVHFLTAQAAFLRSYGVRLTLVIQSLTQLDHIHGNDNSLLDLCGMRVLMATYGEKTAQRMSRLSGETTVTHAQESRGQRPGQWVPGHTQITHVNTRRQLLTTDEVLRLGRDESVVLAGELHPIKATKVRYFVDATWQPRLLKPPAHQAPQGIAPDNPWTQEGIKRRAPLTPSELRQDFSESLTPARSR